MQTLSIKKLTILCTALVLSLGVLFMANAKEQPKKIEESAQTAVWNYQGSDDENEILNASNWNTTAPHPSCGEGEDIPCAISGPADPTEFQTYLNTLQVSGVMANSPVKRPAP